MIAFVQAHGGFGLWGMLIFLTLIVLQNFAQSGRIDRLKDEVEDAERLIKQQGAEYDSLYAKFKEVCEQRNDLEDRLETSTELQNHFRTQSDGLLADLRRERERSVRVNVGDNGVVVRTGFVTDPADSDIDPSVGDEMA